MTRWTAASAAWIMRHSVAAMTGFVGALAAMMRLTTLHSPATVVFDEVYYAREAYSLLALGYEGQWEEDSGPQFGLGDTSGLTERAAYVVHPPLGKWIIALGIKAMGLTPVGWRLPGAIAGVLTVVLVALIARRLLGSPVWGAVAGTVLALDGQHIVMSRHALLDGFMTFFAVAALWMLIEDRRRTRATLSVVAARDRERRGGQLRGWGGALGPRWWRYGAVVALALSCSVKWSGAYFAAAFLTLSVVWDVVDRRRAGYRDWALGALGRGVVTAVGSVVAVAAVYTASWWHWFATDKSYSRTWAADHPGEGITWLPEALRSWVHYHQQMLSFHSGLDAEHTYSAHPLGWIIQYRPTAFHFEDVEVAGSSERWVSAISALGHPMLWWALPALLLLALWRALRHRDTLGLILSVGLWAAWLPWLVLHSDRTVFTFYTVALAPFAAMLLAWTLKLVARPPSEEGRWSPNGLVAVAVFMAMYFLVAGFFTPLWTGHPITYDYWQTHMWAPSSWI